MALIGSLRLLLKRFVTKLKIQRPPNRIPRSGDSAHSLPEQFAPYQYPALPLPGAGRHTRLLRLSPGEFSDDLHVELEQVLLDGTCNYEALSYVWGSTAHPVPVLVGPFREHTISVTQNLATALQHLRDANESRTLWVDALCINQNDLKERSHQVTLMGDIYRAALQVVVWLGPETDDSSHAFDIMHAIGSSIDVDWVSYSFKPKVAADNPPFRTIEDLHNYQFRDKEFNAVNRLLHRQWFERLWIRQEIGLATQAVIQCGKLLIPWQVFRNAILHVYLKASKLMTARDDQYASFDSRIKLVFRVCDHPVYEFQDLRTTLAQTVCEDPRDKIYGILSLLHPDQQDMGIVPDYDRDVFLVYQDATVQFINHTKRLDVLLQCDLRHTSPHMSTWVPDWSIDPITKRIPRGLSNASASLTSIVTSKGKDTLSVAGVAIATIQNLEPMNFGRSHHSFQTMLRALWKMVIPNSTTPVDMQTPQLSAVCDALCGGSFRHTMPTIREDLPDFKSVMQTFKTGLVTEFLFSRDMDSVNEWRKYKKRVKPVCRNRCFFVTTEGSVGIAPLSARPGDIICVLLGCYSPILLRQTGRDAHQVVGQSYISGANHGETLVGPLPEHIRPVHYYNEDSKEYRFAYRDDHTQQVQFEDPRLDKFLVKLGLDAGAQRERGYPNVNTSVEALRNAGIAAQYFDLV